MTNKTQPAPVKEFVCSKYLSGYVNTGLFGYLCLTNAHKPPLRDIVARFTALDPQGKPLKAPITRTLDRLPSGAEHLLGYHFGEIEGAPAQYQVKAQLSWQTKGVAHQQALEAVYRFPLRAPRSLEGVSPILVPYIEKWETELERVAAKVGPECDFWSVRMSYGSPDGYSLGLGLSLPTQKSGQFAAAGIGMELHQASTQPKIFAAGLIDFWDCPQWPTPDEPEDPKERLAELDQLLQKWIPAFFKILEGKGRRRHSSPVFWTGDASTQESSVEVPPGPTPEELDFLQQAFRLLHPKLTGSPLIFPEEVGGADIGSRYKMVDPVVLARLPGLTSDLLNALEEVNRQAYPLPEEFPFAAGDTVAVSWTGHGRDFFQVYPHSPGSFQLSRPSFSPDGKVAAIRHGHFDHKSCHTRELCLFIKRFGRWGISGRLDETELLLQFYDRDRYSDKELAEFQEQGSRAELNGTGLEMLESDFRSIWDVWARIRTPEGRVFTVAGENWVERQLSQRGCNEVFVSSEPILMCHFTGSTVLQALEKPTRQGPEGPPLEKREDIVDRLARFKLRENSSVRSLTYLGHQPTEGRHGLDYFTATLKTGEELPTFTVAHPSYRESEPRFLERWIFLYFFTVERLLIAVERYQGDAL